MGIVYRYTPLFFSTNFYSYILFFITTHEYAKMKIFISAGGVGGYIVLGKSTLAIFYFAI